MWLRHGKLAGIQCFFVALIMFMPTMALAQSAGQFWDFFGSDVGDPYSSVLLNQMFGQLFPTGSDPGTDNLFASIIAYFNVIVLVIGGSMFFYNVSIGVMQSAHEGQVLGQRWSSLWAPLRVILAVGMLVPVNGGYNMAQSGVAYVVKGSTLMASGVWSKVATLVLKDDIPIAAPLTNFNPDIMKDMYNQAACISAMSRELNAADDNKKIEYDMFKVNASNDRHRIYTAVYDGSKYYAHGVCGSWATPETPRYLENIVKAYKNNQQADAANISSARAEELIKKFREGHYDIMKYIQDEMRKLIDGLYAAPSWEVDKSNLIGKKIAEIHTEANKDLGKLITDIRALATKDDGNGINRPRDLLLRRITGNEQCFNEEGSHDTQVSNQNGDISSVIVNNRAALINCYGEGWMGAGTWYIQMAKINNELSTLTDARSSTRSPTYNTDDVSLFSKGFNWALGGGNAGPVTGPTYVETVFHSPSSKKVRKALSDFEYLFDVSTVELAALNYPIATALVQDIQDDPEAEGYWVGRLIKLIVEKSGLLDKTRFLIDLFDPGKYGSSTDPMVNLITLGKWLITVGSLIWAGSAIWGGIAVVALPVFSILLSAGVTLSIILPLMPFLYWVMGVSGYFLLIAEAIIAVNLWALSHLRMDGDGLSGDAGRQGWLMVLALFLTPTLMVLGFIVGMILFRVVSTLMSAGMFYAVSGIIGSNPIVWVFGTLGYIIIIVSVYTLLLERSFSLVSEFPNRVMKWMGGNVEIGGDERRIQIAAGAAAMGVNNLGNAAEKGLQRDGPRVGGHVKDWVHKMRSKNVTQGNPR